MLVRLFHVGLLIASLAMLLFVAGFVCFQFGLALVTGLLYFLASKILLLALVLLALLGLIALIKVVCREISDYFNRESAAFRRVLSLQIYRQDAERRKVSEWRQLDYLNKINRQRLLIADNRKQLRELSDSISTELRAAREQLPAATYNDLRKALRKCHKRADAAAMLLLRQQIPCPR